ncbi:MAG: hypothetical protein OEY52_16395 [Gammaproteobacteria bacterium]|nr:hypothetical protein [Gammaproteobacteria bacterium]
MKIRLIIGYKGIAVLLVATVLISGCGSGARSTSSNTDNDSTNDNNQSDGDKTLQISLSANPASVDAGGATTLTWSSKNTESCTANGSWSGQQATSGTLKIDKILVDSEFSLNCSGSGKSLEKSVSVLVVSSTTGNLRGAVDSSHIDRNGKNAIYVFSGNVTPDDIDGDAGDPVAVVEVEQQNGGCGWNYNLPALAPGEYTIAFTNQADTDNELQDDPVSFVGKKILDVAIGLNIADFKANSILQVGPGKTYDTPSAAAAVAKDGDVIEIDAGLYEHDIVVWRRNNLVLRGVGDGRAHIKATKVIPFVGGGSDEQNGKGIWVTRASNITVENIEFSNAKVTDENGAGIRAEGPNLTVCNSYFHDNENGILGGGGTLTIEFSEFNHNGLGKSGRGQYGFTHNIYVDGGNKLIFRHNYSHHAHVGHNLKSRAKENYILYNRLMDEVAGNSSYVVDIPDGGKAYVIGNVIQQGVNVENTSYIVTYGIENKTYDPKTAEFYFINNTVVNDGPTNKFVYIRPETPVSKLVNNIFLGGGSIKSGPGELISNVLTTDGSILADRAGYDYRLTGLATQAIDLGTAPGLANTGVDLTPVYQYVHKVKRDARKSEGDNIDIGAYEYKP